MGIIFITSPKTLSTKTKLSDFNFSEIKILYCVTKVLPQISLRAEWFGAKIDPYLPLPIGMFLCFKNSDLQTILISN